MRFTNWLLLSVCLVGCSDSPIVSVAKTSSATTELSVPAEVAAFFERGELALAVEKLTEMIAAAPHDHNLYAFRASAYHRQGKTSEALADFDHAIGINSRDARLYNNRGFIYLGLEKLDEALADFNKATELDPRYINAFNNRGLLYIAQKKFDMAIREFNHAIALDGRYVDAFNNRGFAEYEQGQIEQALDDFNLAIDMNSNYVNAYNNRGLLRARAGDFENAIVDFTNAMMIDPLNPKYYEHRRDVYRRIGSKSKASADDRKIEWLNEYHQISNEICKNVRPMRELALRAQLYMRANDDESALRDLEQALGTDPQCVEALLTRATLYLRQRMLPEAKADALAVLAIEPLQEAYSILGDVYMKQRDYDQAIANFSLAHRVDQDVAKAYYAKAKLLESLGEKDQAKENLQQALVLDPEVEGRIR